MQNLGTVQKPAQSDVNMSVLSLYLCIVISNVVSNTDNEWASLEKQLFLASYRVKPLICKNKFINNIKY